jgi:hypothetical protein
MIQVTVSRKLQTNSLASSSVHVGVKPSPVAPRSALGYKDFNVPRVKLDALRMLECITS